MKLTPAERLLLSNQLLILSRLIPNEAGSYLKTKEVVDSGFEANYDRYFEHIQTPVSEEVGQEVRDVLDLFWALKHSLAHLKDKEGLTPQKITFPGFDEQNEDDQLAYAYFLTKQEKKFSGVKVKNSHFSQMSNYRRMLNEWKKFGQRHDLSATEIKSILGL